MMMGSNCHLEGNELVTCSFPPSVCLGKPVFDSLGKMVGTITACRVETRNGREWVVASVDWRPSEAAQEIAEASSPVEVPHVPS
jgi:hypothetical protein